MPNRLAASDAVKLSELVPIGELQRELSNIFASRGSLDWELRVHREQYIAAGAVFEIAGRLLAHPATFRRVALEIGADRLVRRCRENVTASR